MRTKIDAALLGAQSGQASLIDSSGLAALSRILSMPIASFSMVSGGSAGTALLARDRGKARFLKSYPSAAGQALLVTEAALLRAAYGDAVDAQIVRLKLSRGQQLWLSMAELFTPKPAPDPDAVLRLIETYQRRLALTPVPADFDEIFDFQCLISHGNTAAARFVESGDLSNGLASDVGHALSLLKSHSGHFVRSLCHGDLGPRNIMATTSGELIAIDWEDAIWGILGYDYLYWLTFFQNRRFYKQSSSIGVTGLGQDVEIAIMVLIVLIKSYIGALNGTNVRNTLTIEQRISEIVSI